MLDPKKYKCRNPDWWLYQKGYKLVRRFLVNRTDFSLDEQKLAAVRRLFPANLGPNNGNGDHSFKETLREASARRRLFSARVDRLSQRART